MNNGETRPRPAAPPADGLAPERFPHTWRAPGAPRRTVAVGPVTVGGARVVVAAGPCAVEPNGSLAATAERVRAAGAALLRGGAYKPRTSPYDFQGLGEEGLRLLAAAREATGLPVVTEVLDPRDVPAVAAVADLLQIGSRSVQNFPLLREAGQSGRPLLIKRGMMTTLAEWLGAAEYALAAGAPGVILCERGIRTFEAATRNTLDLSAVVLLRRICRWPVLVDPSHASGRAALVPDLAAAAVAAGADGLLVEVHVDPAAAWSDGRQTIDTDTFARLVPRCRAVARAVGREL